MPPSSVRRIAVFTKQLDAWNSGSGHHLNEIMAKILDLNGARPLSKRYDFTFIHYKPSENVIYKRVRELIIPRNPLRAIMILRKERFDLVHYTPLTIYAPIWLVPNKKAATIHGVEQLLIPRFFSPLEMFHERKLVPLFARKMDGILTVSNATKQYMVRHFRVKPGRITVAYNGISREYRLRDREDLGSLKKYGVSGRYAFHISRFSERKNPWVLLEAFAVFVKKTGLDHRLVCAGKGWDGPKVADRAAALGISGRLITPGFISEDEAGELLAAADFFVFPSLAEGFGMPNVEAMAAGCPVITSAAFAIPEIVGDAAAVIENPLDVEAFAEAMGAIARDGVLRESLVRKGLERIKLFSWDEAAEKLMAMYDRILSAGIER
ncbi:MAG: glycosyltransferase family 4 protein [Treponema sp.]|jgi:glycosyltransferase involved in cell wall biosynthesis|nr:glycosyltransferase family 4 protein [Treponema sp.]